MCAVHTDADIDKIQLEIQAGSRAAARIITEVNPESEEEDESSPYEDIQAKLKRILGIDSMFKVRDFKPPRGGYFPVNKAKDLKARVENWHGKARMGLVRKVSVLSVHLTSGETDPRGAYSWGWSSCWGRFWWGRVSSAASMVRQERLR